MWMLHLALLQRATTAVTASAVGERHGESEAVAQLLERAPRVLCCSPSDPGRASVPAGCVLGAFMVLFSKWPENSRTSSLSTDLSSVPRQKSLSL